MEIIDPLGGAEAPAPSSVPPVAEEHPPLPAVPPVQPAGFLRRAVAFLIDTFILQLLYLIIMIVGFLAIRLSMGETFSFAEEASLVPMIAPFVAAWFCLFFGYFTFFHAYGGQTPAKMLIRIKVVTLEGAPLSPLRALLRSFCYFLSSFFFGFGFLIAILEKRKRALHDLLTRTEVILA